jgi:regulator of sirC expression with transglutaminase-like and TPR domain
MAGAVKWLLWGVVFMAWGAPAWGAAQDDPLEVVHQLVATPEARVDLAVAKVRIDRLIDPRADEAATLRQIETFAAKVRARIPAGANRRAKLELLVDSFTQPGPWNEFRPFRYDLDDPFGKNLHNKLLATYLTTRKGNCVTMPILFAIVSQKIGLEATLSTAPLHVFARVKTDEGTWFNVEATSFGTKTDRSYRTDFHITPRAVESGLYLRTLTRRQSLGVVIETLMEHLGKTGQQARRMAVADQVLTLDARNVVAMLHRASACSRLVQERYIGKYPSPAKMPPPQRQDFEALGRCNAEGFAKAEALGWRQETQAENASYRRSIEQVKARQGGER